jgi:hypothetical protein
MSSTYKLRQEYQEFLASEQKKIDDAKLAEATKALSKTITEIYRQQSAYWSRPLDQIRQDGACQAGFDPLNLPCDPTQDGVKSTKVYQKFTASLPEKFGIVLSTEGELRFREYVKTQVLIAGTLLTSESLETMLRRMISLNAFDIDEGEYGEDANLIPPPVPKPAPAPVEPTLADIEKLDTSTRQGDREARRIVDAMANAECAPLAQEFIDHVRTCPEFAPGHVFTYEDGRRFKTYCERFNKSPFDRRTYDGFRVWSVYSNFWGEHMLTQKEKNERELERLGDLNVRENRLAALRLIGR